MRRLEAFENAGQARALADALEVHGIQSQLRSDDDRHEVWIINEAQLEEARELASGFDGAASEALQAKAARIRKQREVESRPVRTPGFARGASLARGGSAGPLTLGLVLVSVGVGVASNLGDITSPILRHLLSVPITPEGYYIPRFDWSQPWRLVTPMLIHFGIFHLLFNMLWLYRLGSQIESVQGSAALLGLVLLTQVPGAWVQFGLTGPFFGGMSGVVYGLFGYSWMQARYGSRGYGLSEQDTLWIMGWFVVCATGLVGPIANAQHALGLVFGLLAGMPAYVAFRRSSRDVRFEKGSWADLNIRGFRRFQRLYFDPYVPLWFVGLAVAVLVVG